MPCNFEFIINCSGEKGNIKHFFLNMKLLVWKLIICSALPFVVLCCLTYHMILLCTSRKFLPKQNLVTKRKILIAGGRSNFSLELARILNKGGHTVFLEETMQYPLVRYSNATSKTFQVPWPNTNFDQFVNGIVKIIKR